MNVIKGNLNPELLSTCRQVFEDIVVNLPRCQKTQSVKSQIAADILRLAASGETDRSKLRRAAQLHQGFSSPEGENVRA